MIAELSKMRTGGANQYAVPAFGLTLCWVMACSGADPGGGTRLTESPGNSTSGTGYGGPSNTGGEPASGGSLPAAGGLAAGGSAAGAEPASVAGTSSGGAAAGAPIAMGGAGAAGGVSEPADAAGGASAGEGSGGAAAGSGTEAGGMPGAGGSAGSMSAAATGGAAMGGSGTGFDDSDRSPEAVCARWNADRQDLSEGTWSGSVQDCDPGDISADGRANALRQYNLYRWLADLPAVETSPDRDRIAQACALLMQANNSLSHDPPMSWTCWTQDAYDGASSSNISTGPGVRSADGYMIDSGNATTIGHRRWILSNSLGPIGLGSTGNGASCMQNLTGTSDAGKDWMAWPPPGAFPLQAYGTGGRNSLSDTGWTIQSDRINLSNAQVSVTSGGEDRPMSVTQLQGGYGSRYAFRFNPEGWDVEAGATYSVSVSGIDTPISYEFQIVDCE